MTLTQVISQLLQLIIILNLHFPKINTAQNYGKKITKACSNNKENFETDPKYKNCNKILEIGNGEI